MLASTAPLRVARRAALAGVLGLTVGWAPGCNFFDELESQDSADDESGEGGSGSESSDVTVPGSGCSFPEDGRCANQDTIERCDPESGELEIYSCASVCGTNTNFSCVTVGVGEHGCWCVQPGRQKVYACSELEDCLADCANTQTGACAEQCFSRTDAGTARLYGALVNCAHDGCQDTCNQAPEYCAGCVETTILTGAGSCGLARSVCDADQNDELGPFG